MASPTTVARVAPTGKKVKEGQGASIAFSRRPGINFWEVTIKPPGQDGGEAVEQTSQLNTTYQQFAARVLSKSTECTVNASYDPDAVNEIKNYLLNATSGSFTIHFPDGSTLDVWGYLQKYEFEDFKMGEQPRITLTIMPTNTDPSTGAEAGPVLTSVSGT